MLVARTQNQTEVPNAPIATPNGATLWVLTSPLHTLGRTPRESGANGRDWTIGLRVAKTPVSGCLFPSVHPPVFAKRRQTTHFPPPSSQALIHQPFRFPHYRP